jgi:hypothetical protein
MTTPLEIEDQKKEINKFLHKRFNLKVDSYKNLNEFLTNFITGIVVMKIWREQLENKNPDVIIYLDEIVSNLNQALIMGAIGFKIPATILIRRSYENMTAFLYYKDHSVEYFLKESEMPRRYMDDKELKSYLEKFPFVMNKYDSFNEEKAKILISHLLKHKAEEYESLSNYTHASNHRYLQLNEYLNDINPNDDEIKLLNKFVMEFNTILNSIFILFFFNDFEAIEEPKKKLIRNSIGGGNRRYKNQIREIFGKI